MPINEMPAHKRTQFPGNTTSVVNSYIGLPREIVVDMTRKELRLHDGVKKGGHRICSLTVLQSLFLALDSEAGKIKFNGGSTGFLTRISDSQYTVRDFKVEDGLIITNADGVDDDPIIGLPERLQEIAGDGVADGVEQDCNLLTASGFYSVDASALNLPTQVISVSASTLIVIKKSSTMVTQILTNIATDMNVWTRTMLAGAWQPWTYLAPEDGTDELLEVGDDTIQRTWSAAQLNAWLTDRLQDIAGDDAVGGTPTGYAGSKRLIKIDKNGPNINDQTEGPFSPVDKERWVVYLSAMARRVVVGVNFEDIFSGGDLTTQLEVGGTWVTVKDMPRGGVTWNSLITSSQLRFVWDDTNNKILICNSDWVTIDVINGVWSGKFRFKTNGNTMQMTVKGYRFKPV